MQFRKIAVMLVVSGLLLIIGIGVWLATAQSVSAQCGSQASSCKNCHETQGQKPVNNDGTAWHTQHAFGDFCYLCHAGNNQATDKVAAHTGMVPPLADINAGCKSCHPTDTLAKAQIYATTLGVQVGADTGSPSASQAPTATPAAPAGSSSAPVASGLTVNSADLVDYVQRYDQVALGQTPVNWGNIILIVMIVLLLLGGGGFVILNEKLVKVTFGDTRKVSGEYPAEVVDMLPAINGLNPRARKSLKKILDKPGKTDKVLDLIEAVVSDPKAEE